MLFDIIYGIYEKISRFYFKHKKEIYCCSVCGLIAAPFFCEGKFNSLTSDFGWHKFKDSNRWICHQCADHKFITEKEKAESRIEYPYSTPYREPTWDEWKENVKSSNKILCECIKRNDPEFYKQKYLQQIEWIEK